MILVKNPFEFTLTRLEQSARELEAALRERRGMTSAGAELRALLWRARLRNTIHELSKGGA